MNARDAGGQARKTPPTREKKPGSTFWLDLDAGSNALTSSGVTSRSAVIEAKPENPGRLIMSAAGEPDRELHLTSLTRAELLALANELAERGIDVELSDVDVEAATPAHGAYAALRELGFAPPFAAYDATLEHMHGEPASGTGI